MPRVPRVSDMLLHSENLNASRETPQNSPGCSPSVTSDISVSEGTDKVHRESNGYSVGNFNSYTTL